MGQQTQIERKKIFISYSRADVIWLRRIKPHFEALEKSGYAATWSDMDMKAGLDWRKQIDDALKSAHMAVLLISDSYLKSRFIKEKELEVIRERASQDGLRVYPIILTRCDLDQDNWISGIQCRPRNGKSLAEIEEEKDLFEAQEVLLEMTKEIRDNLQGLSAEGSRSTKSESENTDAAQTQKESTGKPQPVPVDLRIDHFDRHRYRLEVTFSQSRESNENFRKAFFFRLDLEALERSRSDLPAYTQLLTEALFADEDLRRKLLQVRELADNANQDLCARLTVDPNARELHRVIWELFRRGTPQTNPLVSARGTSPVLNRFVAGHGENWAHVRLRAKASLILYCAIGASPPEDPAVAIDAAAEHEWIEDTFKGEDGETTKPLTEIGHFPEPTTLIGLRDALAQRTADSILYLVCHLSETDEQPTLVLTDADGRTPSAVPAEDLATKLGELPLRPRLIALVPPRNGDHLVGNARYAHAASVLAQAGVTGVITLQGRIASDSWQRFLGEFMAQMEQDEHMDLAMHHARASLEADDDLAPVLFSRLKTARLWYRTRWDFGNTDPEVFWTKVTDSIKSKKCTPIIGPAVSQSLSRTRREISQALADQHLYPLALHERLSLPQVTQYISIDKDRIFPRKEYRKHVMDYVLKRYGELLTNDEKREYRISDAKENELGEMDKERIAAELVELVGLRIMKQDPTEPHLFLAKLDQPLYISANWNRLMAVALELEWKREQQRKQEQESQPERKPKEPPIECMFSLGPDSEREPEPQSQYLPRVGEISDEPSTEEADILGATGNMVYYMYGLFGQEARLVMTEDDYLDFLLGFSRLKAFGASGGASKTKVIPNRVLKALTNSSLLFLGFRLEDWDIRLLFRIISSLDGRAKLRGKTHVAVQVDPDDDYVVDPERTRRYLTKYFDAFEGNTALYWGTAEDFLQELAERIRV